MSERDWVHATIFTVSMVACALSWWNTRSANRTLKRATKIQSGLDHSMVFTAMVKGWEMGKQRELQVLPPFKEMMQITETIIHDNVRVAPPSEAGEQA